MSVDLVKAVWTKRAVYSILGASLGYAYYSFIGCYSGTCPITSNPWISTAYGAGMGLVMAFGGGGRAKNPDEPAHPSPEPAGKSTEPAGKSSESAGKSNGGIE